MRHVNQDVTRLCSTTCQRFDNRGHLIMCPCIVKASVSDSIAEYINVDVCNNQDLRASSKLLYSCRKFTEISRVCGRPFVEINVVVNQVLVYDRACGFSCNYTIQQFNAIIFHCANIFTNPSSIALQTESSRLKKIETSTR